MLLKMGKIEKGIFIENIKYQICFSQYHIFFILII